MHCALQSHIDLCILISVFFFNDTATTEIYTLSLHDALPIWSSISTYARRWCARSIGCAGCVCVCAGRIVPVCASARSEEHTSELQSRQYLVCRLLLEKKKKYQYKDDRY